MVLYGRQQEDGLEAEQEKNRRRKRNHLTGTVVCSGIILTTLAVWLLIEDKVMEMYYNYYIVIPRLVFLYLILPGCFTAGGIGLMNFLGLLGTFQVKRKRLKGILFGASSAYMAFYIVWSVCCFLLPAAIPSWNLERPWQWSLVSLGRKMAEMPIGFFLAGIGFYLGLEGGESGHRY